MKKLATLGLLSTLAACSFAQSIRIFNVSGGFEITSSSRFPFDRIARGEMFKVQASKGSGSGYTVEIRSSMGAWRGPYTLTTFDANFQMPTNPAFDNCRVIIKKAGRVVLERRVPIGRR